MARALLEREILPDLIVGTSVGALNGALIAAGPLGNVVERLEALWVAAAEQGSIYSVGAVTSLRRAVRTRTHVYSAQPLRDMLNNELGETTFAELEIPFQCCAASIERAAEHWFSTGRVVDAVVASGAVPGLLPPARVGDEHFLDGGIVNSIPVGRAVELGASSIYVLHVGRVDRPLSVPRKPWEVARVSFEIARRHRFTREMSSLPEGVRAFVLPTGGGSPKDDSLLAHRDFSSVRQRIDQAYLASCAYLDQQADKRRGDAR
jgi:NTE family protein